MNTWSSKLLCAAVMCGVALAGVDADAAPKRKGKGKAKGKAVAEAALGKQAEADAKKLAQQQFQAGQKHYRLGSFQEALEAYVAAYDLFPVAGLLFNIGQCHMELQNFERAVFFFDQYITEKPYAPNIDVVEERLAEAHAQLKAIAARKAEEQRRQEELARLEQQRKDEEKRRQEEELRREQEERRRDEERRRRLEDEARLAALARAPLIAAQAKDERGVFEKASVPTLVLWGGGVAGVLSFTYFGLKARSAYANATNPTFNGAQKESQAGKTAQMFANISLAVGAASAIGGMVSYLVSDSAAPEVSVVPTQGGAAAFVGFGF